MDEILTTKQVAEHYGVDPRQVTYARKRGKLKAMKFGWMWMFPAAELPSVWPIRKKKKNGS